MNRRKPLLNWPAETLLLVKSNDSTVLETLESAKGVQNQVDQVKGAGAGKYPGRNQFS